MDAVRNGDISKVADMVEEGMAVDIVGGYDITALTEAVISSQTEVVRFLLEKGANVDKQELLGWTQRYILLLAITTLTS